ncbi:hypothetical protein GCM10027174_37480 [Salinifilum aidingensis]
MIESKRLLRPSKKKTNVDWGVEVSHGRDGSVDEEHVHGELHEHWG